MFKPNYQITDKTVRYLTEIAEARGIILNAPLIPKWELDLRRQALLNSTHASTAIEGNRLSLEEVSDLMIGREITAQARDKKEVINYFEALRFVDTLASKPNVTEKDILKLHRLITKDVLENPENSGHYRSGQQYVVVGNRITREITFRPPETKEVPRLMGELVEWLNSQDRERLNPVIEAAVTHYELVRIHPFIDGNGRTARALATLVLVRRDFDTKRFFALDDYYNADRRRYYEALQSVKPDSRDLTYWLEYFSEGVAISIKAVEEKVLDLTQGKTREPEVKQIALDDKQIRVIELIRKQGKATNRDIQELLGVSNKTAYKTLQALIEDKVIKSAGQGRSVFYILGND